MSAIYEDMGLDYGALMEMTTGDVDYTALLSLLLSTVEPNDKDTAYSELTQAVDLAAQLLRETEEKTYLIAEQTGYTDPNYFSYVFKRRFGVSPSKFRAGQTG